MEIQPLGQKMNLIRVPMLNLLLNACLLWVVVISVHDMFPLRTGRARKGYPQVLMSQGFVKQQLGMFICRSTDTFPPVWQ